MLKEAGNLALEIMILIPLLVILFVSILLIQYFIKNWVLRSVVTIVLVMGLIAVVGKFSVG